MSCLSLIFEAGTRKTVSPRGPGPPAGAAQIGSLPRKTVIYPPRMISPLPPAQESNSDRLSSGLVTTGHLPCNIWGNSLNLFILFWLQERKLVMAYLWGNSCLVPWHREHFSYLDCAEFKEWVLSDLRVDVLWLGRLAWPGQQLRVRVLTMKIQCPRKPFIWGKLGQLVNLGQNAKVAGKRRSQSGQQEKLKPGERLRKCTRWW